MWKNYREIFQQERALIKIILQHIIIQYSNIF